MVNSNNSSILSASRERQNEILLLLKERGNASIAEITAQFAVSEMTVRRVLRKLVDAGLVIRTPGGAMAAPSGSMEKTFVERSRKMAGAKDALGRAAAKLVKEGETVLMDSGTTTQYIARYMAPHRDVTVITGSLAILEELAGSEGVRVQLTGGVYRRVSHDLSGTAMIDTLENIHSDKVFFGAAALSFHKGVMNYDSAMPRAFLRAGKQRILVLDSSKVGKEAVYRLCSVESCDLVITDNGVKPSDLIKLRKLTSVLVAE
ncbi:MAG: putative DeoR-family transcriptional regulator [Acidobacteriaceae bacterium]|jgi:DeoR/GlpR family transcriptional regulator of sugar metabolism|nr:putative DeoR-family transcriptional regulator [Acidobacteriaceae bacterium]